MIDMGMVARVMAGRTRWRSESHQIDHWALMRALVVTMLEMKSWPAAMIPFWDGSSPHAR